MSFEQLFEQADQARAYIRITQEQGPSEQLLDFINYDGNLYTDLGLESLGLENMSLTTRHEIMVSKLNPDHLEEMAMEGLVDSLKKWGAWLVATGAVVAVAGAFPILALPLIVGGAVGIIAKAMERPVAPYKEFVAASGAADKAFETSSNIINAIPGDFTEASWKKFTDKLDKTSFVDVEASFPVMAFEHSGWTESNFVSAGKYIESKAKLMDDLSKKCGDKVNKIEKWLSAHDDEKAVTKLVASSIPNIKKALQHSHEYLMMAAHTVGSAAHCFESKKK